MNNLAISPYIGMHILQLQNIKRDSTKKIPINELKIKEEDKILEKNKHLDNNTELETTNKIDNFIPQPILNNEFGGAEIN
jgi:hypothetical protein